MTVTEIVSAELAQLRAEFNAAPHDRDSFLAIRRYAIAAAMEWNKGRALKWAAARVHLTRGIDSKTQPNPWSVAQAAHRLAVANGYTPVAPENYR